MFRTRNKKDRAQNGQSGKENAFEAGAPYSHLSAGRAPEAIASRSMINLLPASSAPRPSTAMSPATDENPNFFFFDKIPTTAPTPYTTSAISPLPPTLPPIPRVASVAGREGGSGIERLDGSYAQQDSKESWLASFASSIREEASHGDSRQPAAGDFKHLPPLPAIPTIPPDSESSTRPHTSASEELRMRSWTSAGRSEQPRRPRTASRDEPQEAEHQHRSSWQSPRPDGEATVSPTVSRPQTSTSSIKSYTQHSETSSNRGSASQEKASTLGHPILVMGPSSQPIPFSPSKFPSESHRPPPRPPNAQSSPQIHSYIPPPKAMPAPPPKSKHKLNLLNPMSLLLKRRSGQNIQHLAEDSLVSHRAPGSYSTLLNDVDPSIRGSIVHDFSAPRDRRNPSLSPGAYRGYSSPNIASKLENFDQGRIEKQHTPVFREHFDDSREHNEAAIHAETLANQDFIARNLPPPMPSAAPPLPPPFGRPRGFQGSGSSPPPPEPPPKIDTSLPMPSVPMPAPLSPVAEDVAAPEVPSKSPSGIQRQATVDSRKRNTHFSTASRASRASRTSRSSIASDASYSSAGLPTHMTSKASRFSFQLAGKDSILQEKMLEERHKQKEAARLAAEKTKELEEGIVEEEDDYDFDDMDDFEEDVPMVGDDWDYSDNGLGSMAMGGLGNMTLDSLQDVTVPNVGMLALKGNPVDLSSLTMQSPPITGLGITSEEQNVVENKEPQATPAIYQPLGMPAQSAVPFNFADEMMDDDLYFDDGMIDEVNFDDTEKFDESVLDDPSHSLYERKPIEQTSSGEQDAVFNDTTDEEDVHKLAPKNSVHSLDRTVLNFQLHQNPNANSEALAEYHNILAMAAIKAAEAGRFERKDSAEIPSASQANTTSPQADSQPSLIPDESRTSQATTASPPAAASIGSPLGEGVKRQESQKNVMFTLGGGYDIDYLAYASDLSDYDSAFEDDPIIAAANADALANDDDGIYGSEFGFYARPRSGSDSDEDGVFSNGGYFGPKEWGEIQRKKSTREPNLTPITERSEYSTRNSFVSIPTLDKGAAASPGLAQLARMSPSWDSEMTLENLSKLRRHAFGGSHTSLGSFSSARDAPSSPLASSPVTAKQENRSASRISNEGRSSAVMYHALASVHDEHEGDDEEAWEDATASDESDFTDTEEVEEDTEISRDTTATCPPANRPAITSRKSFSRPFNIGGQAPATNHNNLPSFQFPVKPPSQDNGSPISPLNTAASFHAMTPNQLGLQPLSPSMHGVNTGKAASGTFYSPIPSLASASKSIHSRSGSDTVTYVQETDARNGESHWILERRRTGEDGVEQLVGRTKIENGTI